jgi:hypothetical protein
LDFFFLLSTLFNTASTHLTFPYTKQSIPLGPFQIFSKIRGDICTSRCISGVNVSGGKFCHKFSLVCLIPVANLPLVSTIPAANLPPVSTTPAENLLPVANNGNNIRLLIP